MRNTGVLVSGIILLACSSEPGEVEPQEAPSSFDAPSSEAIPPPPLEYVDRDGRTWLRQGPAQVTPPELHAAERDEVPVQEDLEYRLPDTVEEFAEDIRAVRLMAGYEYIEAEPPLEKARNLFNHYKYGAEDLGPKRGEPSQPAEGKRVARAFSETPVRVDDASTDYPERTVVFQESIQCSGTMISRGTMVTAAHCLYDTISNTWEDPNFYPGQNGSHSVSGSRRPYGSISCWSALVPTAYKNLPNRDNSLQHDYGVVDFLEGLQYVAGHWDTCTDDVGSKSGYMGWWVITSGELASFATYLDGYPTCNPAYCDYNAAPPLANGMAIMFGGSANVGRTTINGFSLDSFIKGYSGMSGAGMHVYESMFPYLIGLHHETLDINGAHGSRNRLFDATVRDFVSSASAYISSTDTWGPASDQSLDCEARVSGTTTFCQAGCPCVHGEGDCDEFEADCSDSDVWCPSVQCAPGLVCANNKGPGYGMGSTYDVCMKEACANRTLGSAGYCSSGCKCGHGGGDCNYDSDCMAGLHCGMNNGAAFGYASSVDVCVP